MYKEFKWKKANLPEYIDRGLDEMKITIGHWDQENQSEVHRLRDDRTAMLQYAAAIWGTDSSEYKTIKRQKLPQPPNNMAEFRRLKRACNKYLAQEALHEKSRIYREQYKQRRRDATLTLTRMGYIEGDDFLSSHAISFLKEVEQNPTITNVPFPMTESDLR